MGTAGSRYGYICMTCGKTIPNGVNKDGECRFCARGISPHKVNEAVRVLHKKDMKRNLFENIDQDRIEQQLKKMAGF